MKTKSIYSIIRVLIFLSFFLPFIKSCTIKEKTSEAYYTGDTVAVDSVIIDSLPINHDSLVSIHTPLRDTTNLRDTLTNDSSKDIKSNRSMLNGLYWFLTFPDYSEGLTGFGITIGTISSFIDLDFPTWKDVECLIAIAFFLSLLNIFKNNMSLLIGNLVCLLIVTTKYVFLTEIDELLFGFWITTILNILYLVLHTTKKDYAANNRL